MDCIVTAVWVGGNVWGIEVMGTDAIKRVYYRKQRYWIGDYVQLRKWGKRYLWPK